MFDAQAGVQPRILADAKKSSRCCVRNLSMAASGIAQSVAIQEGDRVEAGQTLIKLDDAQQRRGGAGAGQSGAGPYRPIWIRSSWVRERRNRRGGGSAHRGAGQL